MRHDVDRPRRKFLADGREGNKGAGGRDAKGGGCGAPESGSVHEGNFTTWTPVPQSPSTEAHPGVRRIWPGRWSLPLAWLRLCLALRLSIASQL